MKTWIAGSLVMGRLKEPDWITEETRSADFGDKRLDKRYASLLGTLSSQPNKSLPESCKGWTETLAAYRFFDNTKVTAEKVLSPHIEATLERIKQYKTVLLPQDTTEINYSHHASVNGLGPLSRIHEQGFHLHPIVAVTPDRVCLGVLHANMWAREELGQRMSRSTKPIEEKESMRWLEAYRISSEIARKVPNTEIISLLDAEGDIIEVLAEATKEKGGAGFIIRSTQNRLLEDSPEGNKLREEIRGVPPLGTIEFDMPAAKDRTARHVVQELRAKMVELKIPVQKADQLPRVKLNVVHAVEINPPKEEEPIEWFLFTLLPIKTTEQVIQVINYYLCRWEIEIFFKVLKSGCKIEELQLKDYERLQPCIAFYMISTWRILFLTKLGRECPDLPCDVVFEDAEWKAVYIVSKRARPPTEPPSLFEIVIMIAQLGGFLNRKNDGFPGPKAMWQGLQRTRDFVITLDAAQAAFSGEKGTCV